MEYLWESTDFFSKIFTGGHMGIEKLYGLDRRYSEKFDTVINLWSEDLELEKIKDLEADRANKKNKGVKDKPLI